MLNKVRSATSVSSIVVRVLVSTVAVTAVLLLVLLAAASANTEFFDRYYQWLYAANLAVAVASAMNIFTGTALFFYYAALAMGAAVVLGLIARRYVVVDYFQK